MLKSKSTTKDSEQIGAFWDCEDIDFCKANNQGKLRHIINIQVEYNYNANDSNADGFLDFRQNKSDTESESMIRKLIFYGYSSYNEKNEPKLKLDFKKHAYYFAMSS